MRFARVSIIFPKIALGLIVSFTLSGCYFFRSETVSPPISQGPITSQGSLASETLRAINQYRETSGRAPLLAHPGLAALATKHSQRMAVNHKMTHRGFQERSFSARQTYGLTDIAENVQSSWGGSPTGQSITRQWINSRSHRQNLRKRARYAGVGIARRGTRTYSTLLLGS